MKKLGKRTILRIQAMKILFIADIDEISVDEALANAKGGILDNDEINENSEITEDAIKLLEYINDNHK